jgi:hypothetical protein
MPPPQKSMPATYCFDTSEEISLNQTTRQGSQTLQGKQLILFFDMISGISFSLKLLFPWKKGMVNI